jgi:hypothetical protein
MAKKCTLCSENILEEFGKLLGTFIKIKDEKGSISLTPVCSDCQKQKDWIENAKIKSV